MINLIFGNIQKYDHEKLLGIRFFLVPEYFSLC